MGSLPDREQDELRIWLDTRRYHNTDFSLPMLAYAVKANKLKVTVVIPAREVAPTIAGVLDDTVKPLVEAGIVSSVIAIDADSKDNTGMIAAAHGATVVQRATIAPELGASLGKGDALWRALQVTDGDIVAFLDGDTSDPHPAHLLGIIGPLIMYEEIEMVRGCFDRPFRQPNGEIRPHEGGRVSELAARPLLNIHFPQLVGFRQPLAGEFAARRSLLQKLRFPVGYGVEIGTLIDTYRLVGLDALAEVDLGTRQNCHKPLRELGTMAFAVMSTLERRLGRGNGLEAKMWLPWEGSYQEVSTVERPSLDEYLTQCDSFGPRDKNAVSLRCPPFIDVSGVLNFRDIGCCSSTKGLTMRHGLIFRSGDLSHITAKGTAQLQALGIREIFDLRSATEVDGSKNEDGHYEAWLASHKGPERIFAPVFQDCDFAPEALAMRFRDYSMEGTQGFVRAYRSVLLDSGPAITAILSQLCTPTLILLNCAAGKDRTGVIVMLLLLLAGCSTETVAEEYHLTEEGLGETWKAETAGRLLKHPTFRHGDIGDVERMVGAREEVMTAVVRMLEQEWGSVEGYLLQVAGVKMGVIQKCKKVLKGELNGVC